MPHGTTIDSNVSVPEADTYRAQLNRQLTVADPDGQAPLFADPAPVPAMPWKEQPTRGHLMGFVSQGGMAAEGVWVTVIDTRGNVVVRSAQTSTGGFYGIVGLAPGEYRVVVQADPFDPYAFPRR